MEGISIIVTVLNEEKNIRDLIVSLISQEQPIEIIVVDSMSSDKTQDIMNEYSNKYDFISYYRERTTRGAGRNYGVSKSKFNYLAFIDGDAIAGENWIKYLRRYIDSYDIVAGITKNTGNMNYSMERFKLFYKGFDVTLPTSNLMYSKDLFDRIGGFDEKFITAEDIDLNIRAISQNARHIICDDCIVYTRTRETLRDFKKQAYWNGYGRWQLKQKYDHRIDFKHSLTLRELFSPVYVIRNFYGLRGYLHGKLGRRKK